MNDRRAFGAIPEEENAKALEEGIRIYKELSVKYKTNSNASLDMIMNSLCAAMICFVRDNVKSDNHPVILQVIHKILSSNVSK